MGQALHRTAFGHPLVTNLLGKALEKHGIDLREAEKDVGILDSSLVQESLEQIVPVILAPPLTPVQQKLARQACVLRWLHVEPLRALAAQIEGVDSSRGDQYFVGLLNGLQAQHLLYWNMSRSVYEFSPVLRKLLARYLELEALDVYRNTHKVAYCFHRDHLEKQPIYLRQYVPELAYHRTLLQACDPTMPHPSLVEWWEGFLSRGLPLAREPWRELSQSLAVDHELQGILPEDECDFLLSSVWRRAYADEGGT
jgi:hypothetical protein